jgi:hypothetical protein
MICKTPGTQHPNNTEDFWSDTGKHQKRIEVSF